MCFRKSSITCQLLSLVCSWISGATSHAVSGTSRLLKRAHRHRYIVDMARGSPSESASALSPPAGSAWYAAGSLAQPHTQYPCPTGFASYNTRPALLPTWLSAVRRMRGASYHIPPAHIGMQLHRSPNPTHSILALQGLSLTYTSQPTGSYAWS